MDAKTFICQVTQICVRKDPGSYTKIKRMRQQASNFIGKYRHAPSLFPPEDKCQNIVRMNSFGERIKRVLLSLHMRFPIQVD